MRVSDEEWREHEGCKGVVAQKDKRARNLLDSSK